MAIITVPEQARLRRRLLSDFQRLRARLGHRGLRFTLTCAIWLGCEALQDNGGDFAYDAVYKYYWSEIMGLFDKLRFSEWLLCGLFPTFIESSVTFRTQTTQPPAASDATLSSLSLSGKGVGPRKS